MTAGPAIGSDVRISAISVIIPAYRRPAYLRAAIESAANQSLPPFEIIVIDDGATLPADFSPQSIPPGINLQIHSIPHAGQAGARQAGFELSRGEFVLFLDDDDTLHPDALATLHAMYDREPELIAAVGAAETIGVDGVPSGHVNRPPGEIGSADLWRGNQIATPGCVLIRRWAIAAAGGWDLESRNATDYLLWMKLARVGRIAGTEQIVLRYRWHPDNETARGHQFLQLRAFRKVFRKTFPELAASDIEDSVVTSLIEPYIHPAIEHWRALIRERRWGDAAGHGVRIIDGMSVSVTGRQGRRAVIDALALWRPKWLRRSLSES
ncbi:MAG TPA: glycosyltransferase family A protein [Gemmatimonadales bacterium]